MAAGATIYNFAVTLADLDRSVYEDLTLRVAQHPSETDAYMLTRVLAYCLEYEEGIEFSAGIASVDEPAIMVKDLTGSVLAWIEVGSPDASRVHFGSKLAGRTVVYTHRDPAKVIQSWAGKPMHQAEKILLHSFDRGFIEEATPALERRNTMTVSVTEGTLYLDLNGKNFTSAIHQSSAAE